MINPLKSLIEGKRVAIVGPSPHLMGTKMGELIDSYDVVCRLNEIFPNGLEDDYGTRTDIAFWNLCNAAMPNFKQMIIENKKKLEEINLIVCPRHSLHVLPHHLGILDPNQNVFKNYQSLQINNDFYHIGDDLNNKLEKSFGCHPTVGALTIMSILQFEVKELYVCGMSFFKTNNRYNTSKENTYTIANGGIPPKSLYTKPGHNLNKEITFLSRKLKNFDNVTGDDYFKKIILK